MRSLCVTICILSASVFISCERPTDVEEASSGTVQLYPWQSASFTAQMVDSVLIDSAATLFAADEHFYSFLLVRNGFLVKEYYRPPLKSYNDFELRSATKSIVSALVGIALSRGLIDSLDQPMISFFPEYDTPSLDPRTRTITVRHLLTMRAGFDYSDGDPNLVLYSPSDQWVQKTINLPLKYSPGERFYYASVQTHLLSAIITKRSSMSTLAFAKKYLTGPAQFQIGSWEQDPQGIYFGGSGIRMTPRSMARFGELVRMNGFAGTASLIPEAWIRESFIPRNAENTEWGEFRKMNYGYSWWMDVSGQDSIFFAAGSGGQFIIIIPAKNAVIVTAADPNQSAAAIALQEERIIRTIRRYLIPSIK
jgi:CubicO group peptidase (beta-lactamase class C family)